MNSEEIKKIVEDLEKTKESNIVIVDFGNVVKWQESLGWKIGVKQLGILTRHFSGKKFLRKFYYGSDFGESNKGIVSMWSAAMLNKARMSGFEVRTKPVKYIRDHNNKKGFSKKCNFDIEITIDLIKEIGQYKRIILFSGDGDFAYMLEYLKEKYNKDSIVFGTRWHTGAELYDAKSKGIISDILYAGDFESRLNLNR